MIDQMVWGVLRYSLEGALKRLLFISTRPLTENEIETRLVQEFAFSDGRGRESLQTRLQTALHSPHGCFLQTGQGWSLRDVEQDPLYEEIYSLFINQLPLKQGEILRLLQRRTHRSKGELMSKINLEQDWRFSRLEEGDWVLTEWDLFALQNKLELEQEERVVNGQTDIVTKIVIELQAYIEQLQTRAQEIPQEVMDCFEAEDLQSIQALMQERKRVTGMMEELKQLTDKWNQ